MKKYISLFLSILCAVILPISTFALTSTTESCERDVKIMKEYTSDLSLVEESITNPESLTIGDVTYTKEDGLERHRMVFQLKPLEANHITPFDLVPYHNYKWTRGSSYVQNTEIGYLHYRGIACAMGNIYDQKRVVQASISYMRGNTLLKKAISSAYYDGMWHSGGEKTIYVTDSINSNAPKTLVYYDFYSINPQLT